MAVAVVAAVESLTTGGSSTRWPFALWLGATAQEEEEKSKRDDGLLE